MVQAMQGKVECTAGPSQVLPLTQLHCVDPAGNGGGGTGHVDRDPSSVLAAICPLQMPERMMPSRASWRVLGPVLNPSAFRPLQVLEGMVQATQGEVEQHTQALQAVRMKLAPWERQMGEVRSRIRVATSERDLLQKTHAQAQERFAVSACPKLREGRGTAD